MARPRKTGLMYFPLDTEFDDNEKALEVEFGNDGFAVFVKLLQAAFRSGTGEVAAGLELQRKQLARSANVTPERWGEVVEAAMELGLFDRDAWRERGVITSNGIQRRIGSALRQHVKTGESGPETSFGALNAPESAETAPIGSLKGKGKGKGNGNGKGKGKGNRQERGGRFETPTESEAVAYFRERSFHDPDEQGALFWNFYESKGWKVGSEPMKKWRNAAAGWNSRNKNRAVNANTIANSNRGSAYWQSATKQITDEDIAIAYALNCNPNAVEHPGNGVDGA